MMTALARAGGLTASAARRHERFWDHGMATIDQNVSELYVAFFGRPGEPAGASYWDDFVADSMKSGRNIDAVEQEIAARFADSQEAQARFGFLADPAAGDVTAFIDAVYQNLFNRSVESEGEAFWEERFADMLAAGQRADQAASTFVLEILNGAQGDDATAVANKVAVARDYTERFIETGAVFTAAEDLPAARDLVAQTGAAADSVDAAGLRVAEILDANLTQAGVVVDGWIAGADVWADLDGDGERDPGEPTTTTDSQGRFRFTDADGAPIEVGGQIRAAGGTDVSTGLAFDGTLSAPEGAETVSPMTTLVTRLQARNGSTADEAAGQVKSALGLSPDLNLARFDPVATLQNAEASGEDNTEALQLQAATTQVANLTTLTARAVGTATGLEAAEATELVFDQIADALAQAGGAAGLDLSDSATITGIVEQALQGAGTASGQTLAAETVTTIGTTVSAAASSANAAVRSAVDAGGAADAVLDAIVAVQTQTQGTEADQIGEAVRDVAGDPSDEGDGTDDGTGGGTGSGGAGGGGTGGAGTGGSGGDSGTGSIVLTPGDGGPTETFDSIQAALTATVSGRGDRLDVGSGTFGPVQVDGKDGLTIAGAGSGATTFTSGSATQAVSVQDSDGVSLSGFGVDATGSARGLRLAADGGTHEVMVSDVAVSGFEQAGILATGAGLAAEINASQVTGSGLITDDGAAEQIGIQVSNGALATLQNNTVTAIGSTDTANSAALVLLSNAADGTSVAGGQLQGMYDGSSGANTAIAVAVNGTNAGEISPAITGVLEGVRLAPDAGTPTAVTATYGTMVEQIGSGNDIKFGVNLNARGGQTVSADGQNAFVGTDGPDAFIGTNAADTARGGGGEDVLTGLGGPDVLTGGAGADAYVIVEASQSSPGPDGRDVITDFEPGSDHIALFDLALTGDTGGLLDRTAPNLDTAQPGYFVDGATAYAIARVEGGGADGRDLIVIDANSDGDFDAASDAAVEVPNATAMTPDDFFF